MRTVASRQCGPGSIPPRCHMWVEFVIAPRVFSGFSGFASYAKTEADVASSLNIVSYLFIYLFMFVRATVILDRAVECYKRVSFPLYRHRPKQ